MKLFTNMIIDIADIIHQRLPKNLYLIQLRMPTKTGTNKSTAIIPRNPKNRFQTASKIFKPQTLHPTPYTFYLLPSQKNKYRTYQR